MGSPDTIRLGPPYLGQVPASIVPHADKAISQRATIVASIAAGECRISCLADCADTRSNLGALRRLGVPLQHENGSLLVQGRPHRTFDYRGPALDVGNSATTARLLIALLAGTNSRCAITGNALLRNRQMNWLVAPLRTMGGQLSYEGSPGRLPVHVRGTRLSGAVITLEVHSAQAVSASLVAALAASGPVVINRRTRARDHTERLLRWAGIRIDETPGQLTLWPGQPAAFDLTVPGDPSAAAVHAALHLASPRAALPLTLESVCVNPRRMGFFQMLRQLGAVVSWTKGITAGPEPVGSVTVIGPATGLDGGDVGGHELIQSGIDELPLLAALAAHARRPLLIRDAGELRDKDTDRIAATTALLSAFGVRAEPTRDGLRVWPSVVRPPARFRLHPDHRLVFAACVLAIMAGGSMILDGMTAACVSNPAITTDLAFYLPVEEVP